MLWLFRSRQAVQIGSISRLSVRKVDCKPLFNVRKTVFLKRADQLASSQVLSLLWVSVIDLESPVVESGWKHFGSTPIFCSERNGLERDFFSFLKDSRGWTLGVARLQGGVCSIDTGGLLWCPCQNKGGSDLSSPKTSSSGRCFRWRIVCDQAEQNKDAPNIEVFMWFSGHPKDDKQLGSESQHFLKMSSQTSEERYQFFTWLRSRFHQVVFRRNWQRFELDELTRVY